MNCRWLPLLRSSFHPSRFNNARISRYFIGIPALLSVARKICLAYAPSKRIVSKVAMDGVRFTCQPGCINCCNMQGYVYLTETDLERAAKFLGMTARAFEAKYVYRTRHQMRFRKPRDKQCPFLEKHGCSIHPAKPTQCRTFPFW